MGDFVPLSAAQVDVYCPGGDRSNDPLAAGRSAVAHVSCAGLCMSAFVERVRVGSWHSPRANPVFEFGVHTIKAVQNQRLVDDHSQPMANQAGGALWREGLVGDPIRLAIGQPHGGEYLFRHEVLQMLPMACLRSHIRRISLSRKAGNAQRTVTT